MLDQLLDALIDSLKILPFLFAAYLCIEFIEHRASEKFAKLITKFGKAGGVIGAALGCVPQCGFSVACANFYEGKIITYGTLAAVFIATSDEAIPVLVASADTAKYALWLLLIKFALAAAAGLIIDLVFVRDYKEAHVDSGHAQLHSHCTHNCCEHGIFRSALKHTLEVYVFLLATLIAFNLLVYYVGFDSLAAVVGTGRWYSPFLTALLGFIPGCAPSVMLTEMFSQGLLSFGALVAGLVTNTGVGFAALIRVCRNPKTIGITAAILYALALLAGFVIQLF